jgi:uncharacterized protein HemY
MTICALALASTAFSAPAAAQRAELAQRKANVSKEAQKPIVELQAAVTANDVANIPAKLAAAQAVAKTTDEKLLVAQLQLKAAVAAKDELAQATAVEAMIASGGIDQAQLPTVYVALGKLQYKNKQYAQASSSLERALATNPGNTDVLILLAESRHSQGQVNEAVSILQRAVKAKQASGQKADESWYKRSVGMAYEAKLPIAAELGRQWVAAYPTPANWRDALRVYRGSFKLDDVTLLDTLRLARATGALSGDADFHLYAFNAADSSPGEARAVIDEAIAAKQIDPNKPLFKDIVATLKSKKALSQASLPQLAIEAKAGSTARLAVRTGDAYYGYGEYAKAAELYRAALSKSGADANLINLHLGMALARAGDKAGATAALNAVTGPRSELAKYWLVYVGTHA